jgi:predicted AlkP superfamily pyrophosphatase or phosphodiesterase
LKKLLTLVVAGLDHQLIQSNPWTLSGLNFQPMETVFPALTCPVQASLRTGQPPKVHGMHLNGVYDPALAKVLFWEQSARLVRGPRIWEDFRAAGGRVGMMFWQQSLGESVDWVLSPRPIHKHSGGLIQHCYSQPGNLYDQLKAEVGTPFKLQHYWGPLASSKSSEWITRMLCAALPMADCPEWMFAYLPHLDYVLQREGPGGKNVSAEMKKADDMVARIVEAAAAAGFECVVVGDYAIGETSKVLYPNRTLREAGLFQTMQVGTRCYPDFFNSSAFAVVDHEAAEVILADESCSNRTLEIFEQDPRVESVTPLNREDGTRSLLLTAADGSWFAYPWWSKPFEAPDFASHVDIHNKPGFDPCELFFGWPPGSVSIDPQRVKGSHGRTGPGREIAWASTDPAFPEVGTVCDLAWAMTTYMAR